MTAETASEEITLPTNEYNSLGTKMASEEITELLPCPFCGNAPLVDNCGEGGSSIRCRTFMCPLDDIEVSDDTIEDVTKRWNRRDDRHAQCAPSLIEVASVIHEARFGRDYPENLRNSFDTECSSGRAYCIRLARAVMDGFRLSHVDASAVTSTNDQPIEKTDGGAS